IRHHGPGSARSLVASLDKLKPDVVLIEGPPEAEPLLPLLLDEATKPPIALLLYAAEEPSLASFYPQAIFSPEWQAILFAAKNKLPVRFIDLPQGIHFARSKELLEKAKKEAEEAAASEHPSSETEPAKEADDAHPLSNSQEDEAEAAPPIDEDPLTWLA